MENPLFIKTLNLLLDMSERLVVKKINGINEEYYYSMITSEFISFNIWNNNTEGIHIIVGEQSRYVEANLVNKRDILNIIRVLQKLNQEKTKP